jgi:hypothetical protein
MHSESLLSPRRREIIQFLFEVLIQEVFLSDFYLFGLSPFILDLKSIAGEGLEGIHASAEEKAKIPHQQMEGLISKRLGEGGYFDEWEAKVEQLDRANGRNRLVEMKHWTDQMMATQYRTSLGIAYQFEGNRLLPIRLSGKVPPI